MNPFGVKNVLSSNSMSILRRLLLLIPVTLATMVFPCHADTQLSLMTLGTARQSGTTSMTAPTLAIDGNIGTLSQTPEITNSFWEIELGQKARMSRIDVVASSTGSRSSRQRVVGRSDNPDHLRGSDGSR